MDFDGLDDILQETSYVPSFAPREIKKNNSIKDNLAPAKIEKSIDNSSVPVSVNTNRSGGLFGLMKETSKKQPTTFQQFFSKQKQAEKKPVFNLEKNKSVSHFYNPSTSQKQDDAESIISAQRTATRRPISKQRQVEKQSETDSPAVPRRGMMPPLNKKNQATKKQFTEKMDTNNSMDINDNLNTTKPVLAKYKDNDLDPLEALNKQEGQKMKKFLEQQIQYQKKTLQVMLDEERQSKKRQIESMKKVHEEQLKKKLELKDYQISKLKQFYEMQLNLKTTINTQKKQLSTTSSKIDQNLKQLKKIQTRINQQYSVFQNKQLNDGNMQLQRKEALIERRERQLNDLEKRLQQLDKDLKSQKSRIYQEQERERNHISQMTIKLNQREHEFQSRFKRKQKELTEEYEKKRVQLDHQKQKMRYQAIESQQKKLQIQQQQRQLKKKLKGFEDKQKQILEQLHIQRTKQMQKQIQISSRSSQLSMKQNQVEMQRQELMNKMKILELQRKKLEIQAKGSIKSVFTNGDSSIDRGYSFNRNRDLRTNTTGNFQTYHKTISQMRDELMKSMPKF